MTFGEKYPHLLSLPGYEEIAARETDFSESFTVLPSVKSSNVSMPSNGILVEAHANSFTGYGQQAEALARQLERYGLAVSWQAIDRDDSLMPLSPWVDERIVNKEK